MKQKILTFLDEQGIPYIEYGSNVAKGHVNICCPYCQGDRKFFMGINLKNGYYGCWWSPKEHGGKYFYKLVAKLLHCTHERAKAILGMGGVAEDDILSEINGIFSDKKEDSVERMGSANSLELLPEFQQIKRGDIFWNYLKDSRGFKNPGRLLEKFLLLGDSYGDYKFRIIIPYYYRGELVSWASRSILKNIPKELRHKDLSVDNSKRHIKYCIYNYDDLYEKGGRCLFITEGLFDAFKVEYLLDNGMDRATCLSTKTIRDEQKRLILELSKRFDKIVVLLDDDALAHALSLKDELSCVGNVVLRVLPVGVKDPGELNAYQVDKIIRSLVNLSA